jgi:hypothetical protein
MDTVPHGKPATRVRFFQLHHATVGVESPPMPPAAGDTTAPAPAPGAGGIYDRRGVVAR